jgi:hypothetical protein
MLLALPQPPSEKMRDRKRLTSGKAVVFTTPSELIVLSASVPLFPRSNPSTSDPFFSSSFSLFLSVFREKLEIKASLSSSEVAASKMD